MSASTPNPASEPVLTQEVVDRARAGDEAAWAVIYHDVAPRLSGFLRGLGHADSDDVVGEVLVRMVRSIASFSGGPDELRAWAYAIARNARLDLHRSDGRHDARVAAITSNVAGNASLVTAQAPDHAVASNDRVASLLRQLTPGQREVLLLRVVGDLTLQQVAYVLGSDVDAVKQLQRRAVVRLHAVLDAERNH